MTTSNRTGNAHGEKVMLAFLLRLAICLPNICRQQRNFPIVGPMFGSISSLLNGTQTWIVFPFLFLSLCSDLVLGSRFGPPKWSQPSENFAAARKCFLSRFAMHAACEWTSVNTCFLSLCVPIYWVCSQLQLCYFAGNDNGTCVTFKCNPRQFWVGSIWNPSFRF